MAGNKNASQETRASIIKTAKKLFMELGYRAVSTRQIADACGLTQPALYHHFSDKESLYVEVLQTVCSETRRALERIIKREQHIRNRLVQIVHYMMASHPDDLNTMFHDIRHELSAPSQAAILQCWQEAYLLPIVGVFEAGQQEGRLRDPRQFGMDADMSARLLMGLINQSLQRPPVPDHVRGTRAARGLEQQAQTLVDIILYGLASPDERPDPRSAD
ncbi:TetR/AcrR family transcriptional regulator [Paenibacillus spongiae]|uniref:TetR/AcrR family transcriptional regulator n=1 Tax=Paenibacillus spongiae TaxID=2909671 RepID=A0ABY5S6S2_9BACL|nr:TetR/AcrR family transcriptional regulator [Paenibacillus spongiae]UVI29621.1 TetR/AcrR family transcriptional regulator [Paenibacillus spongiae]